MRSRRLAAVLSCLLGVFPLLSPVPANAQASATGQWAKLIDLPAAPVHLSLLPTGKVMMWGRDNVQRLWDPGTEAISILPNAGYDLFCAGHTHLADGRLIVTGGHVADAVGLAKASIYDPATNTWSALPDMNAGRWYPTTTTLPNGDALVVSGEIDTTVGVNTLPQVYEAATNTWRNLTGAQVSQAWYPMMFVAPNGKLVDVAPTHFTRWLDTTGTGTWSTLATRKFTWRDYGSAAMYSEGKILVTGGASPPTATAEVIDLNVPVPEWRLVAPMSIPRRLHNSTLLPDGTVLVNGGTLDTSSTPVFPAELWNPATESWTTMASATAPRMYHSSSLLLLDGRVLTTGGDGILTTEVFSPPYLFKGARPAISAVPASIAYGQRFSVQSADAAAIAKVTLIRLGSVTHGFDQSQRLNILPFTVGAGALDITAPANANLAPPGRYMLFAVNGNGVPSLANVVQLGATAAPPPPAGAPVLNSISPSNATAGGPAFTLTVNGSNFVAESLVRWNGAARTTSFVSATTLTAAITAADIAAAGTAQVSVANPGPSVSASSPFTVAAAPGSCTAPAWVQGRQYAAGDIVTYNGALYIAKFANPGYTPTISTYYWAPYQCPTTPPPSAPTPVLNSIVPSTATAGGPAFTLTVNGTDFVSGAAVRWNGAARTTNFVSGTQLTAAIAAADIAAAGTAQVSVANPGGSVSGASAFTVAAPPTGCTAPDWVQGRQYAAGAIVTYKGKLYIAKFANPGYIPTVSTYYWAPYAC